MNDVQVVDLGPDVDYASALALQRRAWAERVDGTLPDTLYLLEHRSVYTAGVNTRPEDRAAAQVPLVDTDRGGRVTWHGPGQLVGYPIVDLGASSRAAEFVHALEGLLIQCCARVGLTAARVTGRPGVWTADGERKVAAIGIRVRRGVTMHGFAINCDNGPEPFRRISPCGITDATVTSLACELGSTASPARVRQVLVELLAAGALSFGMRANAS